jgi:general secretion pathway protein C
VQAAVILTGLTGTGGSSSGAVAPPSSSLQAASFARRGGTNVATITNAHLFGTPPVLAAAPQDAAHAPQSTIQLLLSGVIAAEDPRNGLAILGQSSHAAKVYAVGDNVPGGAKLYSVYSDRVVIDRSGHLESLALPRQLTSGVLPTMPPPSAAALQTENPVVDRMRRLVTDQPGLLADIMRPQPVYQDSKLRGYRLFPGRNHQAFSRLGLRPGDLVTAINGTPLDDPAHGQEILRTLNSASEAHVTVLRNGQQQDLTLNMAQVAQEAEALAGPQGAGSSDPAQPAAPPGSPPSMQ